MRAKYGQRRNEILKYLLQHEGASFSTMIKTLKIPGGNFTYQMMKLARNGLVSVKKEFEKLKTGGTVSKTRYYLTNAGVEAAKKL